MPVLKLDDVSINYRLDGPEDAPVLVLSNSLGTDLSMWEPQMTAFGGHFRVLRYDARGHGGSDAPQGPYGIDQLGRDVLGLMDGLEIEKANFCGLSMGGMTGLWLGIHAPERFHRLALCNTGAKIGTDELWNARIDTVRAKGMAAVADAVLERWYTPDFRERAPDIIDSTRQMLVATDPAGYCACCAAVRDMDQRAALVSIPVPTLVIAGTRDRATAPAEGHFIAERVPGARYVELDVAHLSNVEQAEAFNRALLDFLTL